MKARRTARGETGRIAVGFTTSAPFHPLVARAIRGFRRERPRHLFVLEESSSGDLLARGARRAAGPRLHPLRPRRSAGAYGARTAARGDGGCSSRAPQARTPAETHLEGISRPRISSSTAGPMGAVSMTSSSRPVPRRGFSPHISQEAPRIVSTLNLVAAGLRHHHRAGVAQPPAAGRCNLPPADRAAAAKSAAQPGLSSRRIFSGDAGLHRPGASPRTKPIKTIGHSNHPIERFVALLKAGGVECLVDVRSTPWSRRHPQFGRDKLAESLAEAGIAYVHEGAALGGKPEGGAGYDQLAARPGVQVRPRPRVIDGASETTQCLMCAEKEPLDCHRTVLVSRHPAERGVAIEHLLGRWQHAPPS